MFFIFFFFFFQAEDGIRDLIVTGVQTCALPISPSAKPVVSRPKRHSQSSAKLWLTLLTLRASHAVTSPLATSSAQVYSAIPRSISLAIGQGRRSSVSKTSLSAARSPPNKRAENQTNKGSPTAVSRTR